MQTIVVTGASGYIATNLVARLLTQFPEAEVRGTVRSLTSDSVKHLKDAQFSRLKLFEADLLQADSFDEAFKGATFVFHTASPFFVAKPGDDPVEKLIRPAVEGTKNVLNAVEKAGTVKGVVLTSSTASVAGSDKPDDYVFSGKDWNETASVENSPYQKSKVDAERAAWEIARGKSWKMAAICPSVVWGPQLSDRSDSQSLEYFRQILEDPQRVGLKVFLSVGVPCVDVKDVVSAHILVAQRIIDGGDLPSDRFLVTQPRRFSAHDVAALVFSDAGLRADAESRGLKAPAEATHGPTTNGALKFDVTPIIELGLQLTPFEHTVAETYRNQFSAK